MKRIYYLSTCDSCRKILRQIKPHGYELTDIKLCHIDSEVLDWASKITGSYKALFNTRAQKLKILPEADKPMSEDDFRRLIISDYTFLKRPMLISGEIVLAGNDKATVEKMEKSVNSK